MTDSVDDQFEVRRLPKVPNEVLKHFRQELPASEVEFLRPVATRGVWDALASGETDELVTESLPASAAWDKVDIRTMPASRVQRRSRTAVEGTKGVSPSGKVTGTTVTSESAAPSLVRKRELIVLRGKNGRVGVDVRAMATIRAFLSDNMKILPRRKSGLSMKSQRRLAKAVKTARHMALLHPEPKGPTMDELLEMDQMMER